MYHTTTLPMYDTVEYTTCEPCGNMALLNYGDCNVVEL